MTNEINIQVLVTGRQGRRLFWLQAEKGR